MAEALPNPPTQRYAVVTGANRGIGFQISKQLASKGITVIFTSKNITRGLQALQTLKQEFGLTHNNLVFHQLDIDALVQFIKTNYGKLDILVNNANAGVLGVEADAEALLCYTNSYRI